jgi:hypothetical protein
VLGHLNIRTRWTSWLIQFSSVHGIRQWETHKGGGKIPCIKERKKGPPCTRKEVVLPEDVVDWITERTWLLSGFGEKKTRSFLLFAVGTIIIKPIRKKEVVSSSFLKEKSFVWHEVVPYCGFLFLWCTNQIWWTRKYTSSGSLSLWSINSTVECISGLTRRWFCRVLLDFLTLSFALETFRAANKKGADEGLCRIVVEWRSSGWKARDEGEWKWWIQTRRGEGYWSVLVPTHTGAPSFSFLLFRLLNVSSTRRRQPLDTGDIIGGVRTLSRRESWR